MNRVFLGGPVAWASLAVVTAAGCTTDSALSSSDEGAPAAATGVTASPAAMRFRALSTIHTRDVVRDGTAAPLGRLASSQVLGLDLVLPVRDRAGLEAFAADVSDPASLNYRHYLTVQEFTDAFGPTQADYDAIVAFAGKSGLEVTGGTRDGMDAGFLRNLNLTPLDLAPPYPLSGAF
jgi:Pro-kumamolisin, activation domain